MSRKLGWTLSLTRVCSATHWLMASCKILSCLRGTHLWPSPVFGSPESNHLQGSIIVMDRHVGSAFLCPSKHHRPQRNLNSTWPQKSCLNPLPVAAVSFGLHCVLLACHLVPNLRANWSNASTGSLGSVPKVGIDP